MTRATDTARYHASVPSELDPNDPTAGPTGHPFATAPTVAIGAGPDDAVTPRPSPPTTPSATADIDALERDLTSVDQVLAKLDAGDLDGAEQLMGEIQNPDLVIDLTEGATPVDTPQPATSAPPVPG